MKKSILSIALVAALTGCATLDNQNASKGTKTAEATGVGAVAGAFIGNLFGIREAGAVAGALIAGFAEYNHATNLELAEAKRQADELKAKQIQSEIKESEVKVKDENGMMQANLQLTSFSIHSTSADAISAAAMTAEKSQFGGKIVVVAPARDKSRINDDIKSIVHRDGVSVAYFTPAEAKQFGAKTGIAWVPVHHFEIKQRT